MKKILPILSIALFTYAFLQFNEENYQNSKDTASTGVNVLLKKSPQADVLTPKNVHVELDEVPHAAISGDTVEKEFYFIQQTGPNYSATNYAYQFAATFGNQGARFDQFIQEPIASKIENNGDYYFSLNFKDLNDIPVVPLEKAHIHANENRIEMNRGSIIEWYENSPEGVEQGFTVLEGPQTTLTLNMDLDTDLTPSIIGSGTGINFNDARGNTHFSYEKLVSWDANGTLLTSHLTLQNDTVTINVDASSAQYPVYIDPMITVPGGFVMPLITNVRTTDRTISTAFAVHGNELITSYSLDENTNTVLSFFDKNPDQLAWEKVNELMIEPFRIQRIAYDGIHLALFGYTGISSSRDHQQQKLQVYKKNQTWEKIADIAPQGWSRYGYFDFSEVCLSGNVIAVGFHRKELAPDYPDIGEVWIFDNYSGNWAYSQTLTSSDGGYGDQFAYSLALQDDRLVVGAPLHNDGVELTGAAYLFNKDSTTNIWTESKQLSSGDHGANQQFGTGVAIQGDLIVATSAPNVNAFYSSDNRIGHAYMFEKDQGGTNNWGEVRKLSSEYTPEATVWDEDYPEPDDTLHLVDWASYTGFGSSVRLSGENLIVGAKDTMPWAQERNTPPNAIYIFNRHLDGDDNWGLVRKQTLTDRAPKLMTSGALFEVEFDPSHISLSGNIYAMVARKAVATYQINQYEGNNIYSKTAVSAFGFELDISNNQAIIYGHPNWEIYNKDENGTWDQVQTLGSFRYNDGTGHIDENTIVHFQPRASLISIYEKLTAAPDSWSLTHQIDESAYSNVLGTDFGYIMDSYSTHYSSDFDGDTIATRIQGHNRGVNLPSAEGVLVFNRNQGGNDQWGLQQVITPPQEPVLFGNTVRIDGQTLAVAQSAFNKVHIYDYSANTWTHTKTISHASTVGNTMELVGDTLAVVVESNTAVNQEIDLSIELYGRNVGGTNNWGLFKTIKPLDAPFLYRHFQQTWRLGMSEDYIAFNFGPELYQEPATTYVFYKNEGGNNNWGLFNAITSDNIQSEDKLGYSLAIDGASLMVGAYGDDFYGYDRGTVYHYSIDPSAEAESTPEPAPYTGPTIGADDLLWQNRDGRIALWSMNNNTQMAQTSFSMQKQEKIITVKDFDKDGYPDILWHHKDGTVVLWYMEGIEFKSSVTYEKKIMSTSGWKLRNAADFDKDGNLDLCVYHPQYGVVKVWHLDQNFQFIYETRRKVPKTRTIGWILGDVADMNGDGYPDLLWHKRDDMGPLKVWYMQDMVRLSEETLTVRKPYTQGWRIKGLYDANGDNETDILWYRKTDGKTHMWHMNGATRLEQINWNLSIPSSSQWWMVNKS